MSGFIKTMSRNIILINDIVSGDEIFIINKDKLSIGKEKLSNFDRCVVKKIEQEVISVNVVYEGMPDDLDGTIFLIKSELYDSALFCDEGIIENDFSLEQTYAYTQHLRSGDAIWQAGRWWEVKYSQRRRYTETLTTGNGLSIYPLSIMNSDHRHHSRFPAEYGYYYNKENNLFPYHITKAENFILKGSERFIWLGASDSNREFGKVYDQPISELECRDTPSTLVKRDYLGELKTIYNGWAIIPRYANL